jgi:hypothetical protein
MVDKMTRETEKRLSSRLSLLVRNVHKYHSYHNWAKVQQCQKEAREIIALLKKTA